MSKDTESINKVKQLLLSDNIAFIKQGCELAETMYTDEESFRSLLEHIGPIENNCYLKIWSMIALSKYDPTIIEETTSLLLDWKMNCAEIPSSIAQLTNLQELIVDMSQLTALPAEIGSLINLTVLHINSDADVPQLTKLPDTLGQLKNLWTLKWTCSEQGTLGDWIGQLTNLRYLDLQNNGFTSLPKNLGNLTNLYDLNLANNCPLTKLPDLSGLTKLDSLDLSFNDSIKVPDSFGSLKNLRSLNLEGTYIMDLPESFYTLTNLEVLYASEDDLSVETRNRIKEALPDCSIETNWTDMFN